MKTVKGYNKIQLRNKFYGLEIFDLLILILIYLIVFVISSNLILNLGIVMVSYLGLRIYKRGKAPHWTSSVIRFITRPKKYLVKRERQKEVFEQ